MGDSENKSPRRIGELRRQIEEVAGPVSFGIGDCPPEIEAQFLEHVLAFESEEQVPLLTRLGEANVAVSHPDELTDDNLELELWQLIHVLALIGVYLHNTNHLSSRELYDYLWREVLREPVVLFPHDPAYATHIDLVGSGSDEDIIVYLRYYADEPERRDWAREFPDLTVPVHEEPPYDRDRFLPQHDWSDQPRQV